MMQFAGNCAPKDRLEMSKLKNYFELNANTESINSISIGTGISVKNLNRYLNTNEFVEYSNQLNSNNNVGNISINL